MRHGLSQPLITIVAGDDEIEPLTLDPQLNLRLSKTLPGKGRR